MTRDSSPRRSRRTRRKAKSCMQQPRRGWGDANAGVTPTAAWISEHNMNSGLVVLRGLRVLRGSRSTCERSRSNLADALELQFSEGAVMNQIDRPCVPAAACCSCRGCGPTGMPRRWTPAPTSSASTWKTRSRCPQGRGPRAHAAAVHGAEPSPRGEDGPHQQPLDRAWAEGPAGHHRVRSRRRPRS